MNDIRVIIRFKNNCLYKRIFSKWPSVSAFCRDSGLNDFTVGELINFKTSPLSKNPHGLKKNFVYGDDGVLWKSTAVNIANALGCLPEHIFPEALREARKNKYEMEVNTFKLSNNSLLQIEASDPEKDLIKAEMSVRLRAVVKELTPRQQKIISERFGLYDGNIKTLEELAGELGISRERVRQIERVCINRLRHPKLSYVIKGKTPPSTSKKNE